MKQSFAIFGWIAVFFLLIPLSASSFEIKANLGLGAGMNLRSPDEDDVFLSLTLHSALLWGRDQDGGWAAGPDLFIGTDQFENLNAGAGAALLVPVSDTFPLVVSAEGLYRRDPGGEHAAGVLGRIWWGIQSRNRESVYVGSVGLFTEARIDVWGDDRCLLLFGIDFDALTLIAPLWKISL